jgi:histone deacetylase 1/2
MPVTHTACSPILGTPFHLNNILVSPSLVKNLISVRAFTRDNNVSVEFDPFGFSIKDLPTRMEMLRCNSAGSLYPFRPTSDQALLSSSSTSADLWHQRLGHPGRDTFNRTVRQFEFQCTKTEDHSCRSCKLGKHTRLPFQSSDSVSFVPFQLVHGDVWTSPVSSNNGFKFYLVLIDACTHYVWTFPLRAKSEVSQCLLQFHAYVLTQFQLPLIAFQTDNGKEFDNTVVRQHFAAHGISFRLTCPYTSAQNGKAERIIRTLNDCVRSLLVHANTS